MLAQKYRFHGHGSLRFLYKNGQAIRSSLITMKYISNPRRRHSRFTVVIGKKVIKSAVRRNRLRRRIYEIIRLEIPTLKDSYDVALMVFSGEVYSMDHQSLTDQVKQLFSQAQLFK
ncbi:ribonuclease P protein component [Candidatus Saccharibacteria bacterium 32-49-12]|nr:MAG: ribonuclease P protein component [Candidatus Saccharibacteria bacterium 32-49-12]